MQLKIYQKLNQLLLIYLIACVGCIAFIFFNQEIIAGNESTFAFIFVAVNVIFYFLLKFLEINTDKYFIQKMAINNHIALANIKSAVPYMVIRESSMKKFRLWEINVDVYDHDLNKHEITFYEKLNMYTESIPKGTIFVTYDEKKVNRMFAIPNNMVSHCNDFAPCVAKYESSKNINIKYLNVYHNAGIVIETYQDTLKNSRQEESEA